MHRSNGMLFYISFPLSDATAAILHYEKITKIDHHRGPVSGLQVSHVSDVLVSSSHDATVCLWSLDDFTLLNTIQLNSPILNIQISSDSVSDVKFSILFAPSNKMASKKMNEVFTMQKVLCDESVAARSKRQWIALPRS